MRPRIIPHEHVAIGSPRSEPARKRGARHADVVVDVKHRRRRDAPATDTRAAAAAAAIARGGLEAILYAGGGVGIVHHLSTKVVRLIHHHIRTTCRWYLYLRFVKSMMMMMMMMMMMNRLQLRHTRVIFFSFNGWSFVRDGWKQQAS